jgi:flagellar export protein FliJ
VKTFRFPLQKVLEWRRLQERTEEEKLSTLQNQLAAVAHREAELALMELNAEMNLLRQEALPGSDFRALAGFQIRLRNERASLLAMRETLGKQITEQRKRLLRARRDHKIVESLKEKRKQQWAYMNDRELENLAAESYISNWVRSNTAE